MIHNDSDVHTDRTQLRPLGRLADVDALLYRALMENGHPKGITHGEASWVLEENAMMNRAAEMMGGEAYKVYGVYGRGIQK